MHVRCFLQEVENIFREHVGPSSILFHPLFSHILLLVLSTYLPLFLNNRVASLSFSFINLSPSKRPSSIICEMSIKNIFMQFATVLLSFFLTISELLDRLIRYLKEL